MSGGTSKPRSPSVTFSKFSELVFIPKDITFSANKWYSSNDYDRFRQVLVQDAIRISNEISDLAADSIPLETLIECIGIEVRLVQLKWSIKSFAHLVHFLTQPLLVVCLQRFISKGVGRQLMSKKREHINSVLFECERQKRHDIYDTKNLSNVSASKSRWAVKRAVAIAAGCSNLG